MAARPTTHEPMVTLSKVLLAACFLLASCAGKVDQPPVGNNPSPSPSTRNEEIAVAPLQLDFSELYRNLKNFPETEINPRLIEDLPPIEESKARAVAHNIKVRIRQAEAELSKRKESWLNKISLQSMFHAILGRGGVPTDKSISVADLFSSQSPRVQREHIDEMELDKLRQEILREVDVKYSEFLIERQRLKVLNAQRKVREVREAKISKYIENGLPDYSFEDQMTARKDLEQTILDLKFTLLNLFRIKKDVYRISGLYQSRLSEGQELEGNDLRRASK